MRVKLSVCDFCGACCEDDGMDWVCTGDPDARHKAFTMRHAEFIEAGELERQVAAFLDSMEGEELVQTPGGPFYLEGLRASYQRAQWSSSE